MGISLDELLNESGITSLEEEIEKVASENTHDNGPEFDIVEKLRKYASSQAPLRDEAARELSEKTAEILVIKQTMEEIEKLSPAPVSDEGHDKTAAFIKAALDNGHSEEEIAQFVKESGVIGTAVRGALGRAKRSLDYLDQGNLRGLANKAKHVIDNSTVSEYKLLRRTLTSGSQAEITHRLADLEGKIGRPKLIKLIEGIKMEGTRLPHEAYRMLPKPGQKPLASIVRNGKTYPISADIAKKSGMIGAGLGTGYALSGRHSGNNGSSRGGVTVIH